MNGMRQPLVFTTCHTTKCGENSGKVSSLTLANVCLMKLYDCLFSLTGMVQTKLMGGRLIMPPLELFALS